MWMGDLAVGGNEIEVPPRGERLFYASVYSARVDDEFILDIQDGDFGLFYCIGTTTEDIGQDTSDSLCLDRRWRNHYNVLFMQRNRRLFPCH